MKIKAIIETVGTKRDSNGNVYHMSRIINPANGKHSEWFDAVSTGNVRSILFDAFGRETMANRTVLEFERSTGSSRISSLPKGKGTYFDRCRYSAEYKKLLQGIGYRGLTPVSCV